MYEQFEKGICDKLSLDSTKITKEARHIFKLAYLEANGLPTQPQPKKSGGIPWKTLAGVGLAGAGAAYGYGRMNPDSALSGFSGMIDKNIVNPAWNALNPQKSTPAAPYHYNADNPFNNQRYINSTDQQLNNDPIDLNGAKGGLQMKLDGVKDLSPDMADIQNKSIAANNFYQPPVSQVSNGLQNTSNIAGLGALATLPVSIAGSVTGNPFISQWAGGNAARLGAVSQMPSYFDFADKSSDAWGITNHWGRSAMRGLTAADGIAAGVVGNKYLGFAGGLAGDGIIPAMNNYVNRTLEGQTRDLNLSNSNSSLANSLNDARIAARQGNPRMMDAWFRGTTPSQQGDVLNYTDRTAIPLHDMIMQKSQYSQEQLQPPSQPAFNAQERANIMQGLNAFGKF